MIPSAPLATGTLVGGDFRVVRPLARGGMGMLYVVEQVSVGAERALKVMHGRLAADARLRERFLQEARASAKIDSDHVVQVIAAGIDDATGTPWMVQELLRGEDLSVVMERRGRLDVPEVLEVFRQLCHALGAAHRAGLVHRDLKPENIFLANPRREGSPFTVKLLDFGIAKLLEESSSPTGQSHTTTAMGSPLWMAPEQAQKGHVSPATDVWALGLVGFFLLTGCTYWRSGNREDGNVQQVLREIFVDALPAASDRARELHVAALLPPGFDGWFARCVHRDASQRFPSATEALAGITPVLVTAGATPFGSITPLSVASQNVIAPAAIAPTGVAPRMDPVCSPPAINSPGSAPPPTEPVPRPSAPVPTRAWNPDPALQAVPAVVPATGQATSWPPQGPTGIPADPPSYVPPRYLPLPPAHRGRVRWLGGVAMGLTASALVGVWYAWHAGSAPPPIAPPVPTASPPVRAPAAVTLASGAAFTCALGPGGTISCWGQNRYGQLGDGNIRDRHRPGVAVGITAAVEVSSGYASVCARLAMGTVRCWGSNASGQLGDGTVATRDMPTAVNDLPPVAEVALGEAHTCARTADGHAWCWGRNEHGQLGVGDTRGRLSPTVVTGIDQAVQLALGSAHTCALRVDGTVLCWGANDQGQLGVGTLVEQTRPAVVPGLTDVVYLAAGGQRTCAALRSGVARCWGRNDVGQLGDGSTQGRAQAVDVVGIERPVVSVAVGPLHTCARLDDRTLRCWGDNADGELGDGTTVGHSVPVPVVGLTGVTEVTVSLGHTCARQTDGTVLCWGHNADGELGDGTTLPRPIATPADLHGPM